MDNIEIRYSKVEDGEYIKKWLEDKDLLKWYFFETKKEIEEGINNWIGFSKFKASLTALYKGEIAGVATLFLMPYKKVSHQCSLYMIVEKQYQKQGVGRDLLKNILNLAENYFNFESVEVEVFTASPLIKLLKEFGFESFACQEGYLHDNGKYLARILYQKFFEKKRFKVWRG